MSVGPGGFTPGPLRSQDVSPTAANRIEAAISIQANRRRRVRRIISRRQWPSQPADRLGRRLGPSGFGQQAIEKIGIAVRFFRLPVHYRELVRMG